MPVHVCKNNRQHRRQHSESMDRLLFCIFLFFSLLQSSQAQHKLNNCNRDTNVHDEKNEIQLIWHPINIWFIITQSHYLCFVIWVLILLLLLYHYIILLTLYQLLYPETVLGGHPDANSGLSIMGIPSIACPLPQPLPFLFLWSGGEVDQTTSVGTFASLYMIRYQYSLNSGRARVQVSEIIIVLFTSFYFLWSEGEWERSFDPVQKKTTNDFLKTVVLVLN